jgi:MFS family permease
VLAPWAGAAADRLDRRKLLVVVELVATALAALLAALAWKGLATAEVVIGLSLAVGVATAFASPAQQALILSLVEERDVPTAVALNSMTFNIARAAGPTGAAVAVATIGIPAAFLVNAFSYLALVVGVLVVRPRPQQRATREEARLRESFHLLRREPALLGLLAIVTTLGFASDPVNTLSPAFAHAFGYRDTVAGVIVGCFGAGAVVAAFTIAGRASGSRLGLAATLALEGTGVALFALTPWLWLALAFLVGGGFGYLASNTAATTRLQLGVAENQRGRIMALWSVAFLGLRPVASLADGALASVFGVRVAGVALGSTAIVCGAGLLVSARRPASRPRPRPDP